MKIWLTIFTILLSYLPAQGEGTPSLEECLTETEIRAYQSNPQYKSRMKLLRQVLGRQGREITGHVRQHRLNESRQVLREIRSIVQVGSQENDRAAASGSKDVRSKEIKRLEIALRKLVETLDELKLAVPFEARLVFEETASQLENFRNRLLSQLFGQHLSRFRPQESPAQADSLLPKPVPSQNRRRRTPGISGDQFTDAEYEKIQDAQDLKKRVEAFLDIAEVRLAEIERRMSEREWVEQEPNPLEFYTYAQMMHAYQRALEGIMINIDEKAKYKLAEPKEIKKSLQMLNQKMQQFIPRLEPIRQLSLDLKDEELYMEIRRSLKASDNALKGSQFGLGAPEKN